MNIRILRWDEAKTYAKDVRREVFIKEQCVPEDEEWDDWDEDAVHAVAFNDDNHAIGYARLLNSRQLGRMAVLSDFRHQGAGTALMNQLEEEARRMGYDHVFLHAQVQALPFYEKQGYVAQGQPFDEVGITHMLMTKILGPVNAK